MNRVLKNQERMRKAGFLSRSCLLMVFLFGSLFSSLVLAQHTMHSMPGSGSLKVVSMPDNDEVLGAAPKSIMLQFGSEVQLVKLAVKNPDEGKEPIDIGFRYSPEMSMHFMQTLPTLAAANYYTVEWAAFDARHVLVKGVFYFSFGADAKPPSFYLNQIKQMEHIMSPDYRVQ